MVFSELMFIAKNQMKYKKTLCGKMHFPNIRVGGTYTGVLLSP
jgi:hypothetical protein